jgi:hypothetical protein
MLENVIKNKGYKCNQDKFSTNQRKPNEEQQNCSDVNKKQNSKHGVKQTSGIGKPAKNGCSYRG